MSLGYCAVTSELMSGALRSEVRLLLPWQVIRLRALVGPDLGVGLEQERF